MTYQLKTYKGEPKHCCLMMDMALDEGYLGQGLSVNFNSNAPPFIRGQKLTPRGKAQKPNLYVNYCPWCGKPIQHKETSETDELTTEQ